MDLQQQCNLSSVIILKHIDTSLPQGIKELRAGGRIIQRIVVHGGGIFLVT